MTIAAYADTWLARQRERGVRSIRVEEQKLRAHVLPLIGERLLESLRPRDVIRMVEQLKRRRREDGRCELAPRTVINAYQVFRRMMRDGESDELVLMDRACSRLAPYPASATRSEQALGRRVHARRRGAAHLPTSACQRIGACSTR